MSAFDSRAAVKGIVARVRRRLNRLFGDEQGEAMIGFAILMPIIVILCIAILEFSLVVFDYHRASEATRRAARTAVIGQSVISAAQLLPGGSIVCTGGGGAVTCGGGAAVTPAAFNGMIAEMQQVLPIIQPQNVAIEYRDIGLGDPATPGGIIPLVTVRLQNLAHPFLMLGGFPGFGAALTFPPFTTNQVAGGLGKAS